MAQSTLGRGVQSRSTSRSWSSGRPVRFSRHQAPPAAKSLNPNAESSDHPAARCSAYSRMLVVARIADPSNDGPSTAFGILFHAAESDPAPSTSLRQCVRETHAPRLRLKGSWWGNARARRHESVVGHRRSYQLTISTPVWTACTVLNTVGQSTALKYSPGSQSRMGEQRARW